MAIMPLPDLTTPRSAMPPMARQRLPVSHFFSSLLPVAILAIGLMNGSRLPAGRRAISGAGAAAADLPLSAFDITAGDFLPEVLLVASSADAAASLRGALAVLSRLRTADIGLEPAPVACAAARPASSTGAIANCANFFMIAPLLGRRRRCLRPSLGEIV